MTREQFLREIADIFQRVGTLAFDMELADIEEWDSLSIMATMVFLDRQFGVKTSMQDYKAMRTVEDLARKAGL